MLVFGGVNFYGIPFYSTVANSILSVFKEYRSIRFSENATNFFKTLFKEYCFCSLLGMLFCLSVANTILPVSKEYCFVHL